MCEGIGYHNQLKNFVYTAKPGPALILPDYYSSSVFPLHAKSSDLSPIKHLWDTMYRRVRRRRPITLAQLERFLYRNGMRFLRVTFRILFVQCVDAQLLWESQTEDTGGIDFNLTWPNYPSGRCAGIFNERILNLMPWNGGPYARY